jgi:hypothetical protein
MDETAAYYHKYAKLDAISVSDIELSERETNCYDKIRKINLLNYRKNIPKHLNILKNRQQNRRQTFFADSESSITAIFRDIFECLRVVG